MNIFKAIAATCLVLSAGLLLGGTISYMRAYYVPDDEAFISGPWRSSAKAGTAQASRFTRNRTALHIPLSLSAEEAEYFYADTDTNGQPLTSACTYHIAGALPEARWWSLTAYNRRGQLIASQSANYSYSFTDWSRLGQSGFAVSLATDERAGEWTEKGPVIALPGKQQVFNLLLRIYNPNHSYLSEEAASTLPTIQASCGGEQQL